MKHTGRVDSLAALLVKDPDDESKDCIAMWPAGPTGENRACVGYDELAVADLRKLAPTMARRWRVKVALVRFSVREDLETFEP